MAPFFWASRGWPRMLTGRHGRRLDILPDASLQGWTRIPIPAISGVNPSCSGASTPRSRR